MIIMIMIMMETNRDGNIINNKRCSQTNNEQMIGEWSCLCGQIQSSGHGHTSAGGMGYYPNCTRGTRGAIPAVQCNNGVLYNGVLSQLYSIKVPCTLVQMGAWGTIPLYIVIMGY